MEEHNVSRQSVLLVCDQLAMANYELMCAVLSDEEPSYIEECRRVVATLEGTA